MLQRDPITTKLVTLLFCFIIVVLYIFLGAALFSAVELSHEKQHRDNHLFELFKRNASSPSIVQNLTYSYNASACWVYEALEFVATPTDEIETDYSWTYSRSLMYSFTIISTLGYGHIIPLNKISQGMTMIFAVTSIPIYFIMIGVYAKHILALLDGLIAKCTADHFQQKQMRHILLFVLFSAAFLIFAGVSTATGIGSYADSMWFAIISFTTIGFGDFAPTNSSFGYTVYFITYVTVVYVLIAMMILSNKQVFLSLHKSVALMSYSICRPCCGNRLMRPLEVDLEGPQQVHLQHPIALAEEDRPVDGEMEEVHFDSTLPA